MTMIKMKSFKNRDVAKLDEMVTKHLEEVKATEIVHVTSASVSATMLAVSIFYKCGGPVAKKPRGAAKQKPEKPAEIKAVSKDQEIDKPKEVNNG